jgi:hypothetical protein
MSVTSDQNMRGTVFVLYLCVRSDEKDELESQPDSEEGGGLHARPSNGGECQWEHHRIAVGGVEVAVANEALVY